jgi:hypothetical protein
LFKIVTLRKTLEGLKGLDAKIDRLAKKTGSSKKSEKKKRVTEEEDESEINMEDYDMEPDNG